MKIFHWIFGSFFRTIGRTLALLLMGGLFYYILSSNGIGITDLFFDKVNADTWGNGVLQNITCDNGDCYDLTGAPTIWGFNDYVGQSSIKLNKFHQYRFILTIPNNVNYVEFQVLARDSFTQQGNVNISAYVGAGTGETWCTSVSYNQTTGYYTLSCPIKSGSTVVTSLNMTMYWYWANGYSGPLQSGVSPLVNLSYNENAMVIEKQQQTTDAITNQTQQQQQQHQEVMDDNTTQAQDDAEGFFSSFSTPDVGGLSAIITAPLNTIRSLLTSTCTNLVLPLPYVNKDLTLPCMNDIYTQHFGLFFTLYRTIILAIISYRCIRSVFFDIKGFSNPDDDRIEVMDL